MQLLVSYFQRSTIAARPGGLAISLEPNLRRDRVSFVGALRQPLRFREAISALHDVVVSDLRYQPKDRSDYEAYLAEQRTTRGRPSAAVPRSGRHASNCCQREQAEIRRRPRRTLRRSCAAYWDARLKYSDYLSHNDPELWRLLVPCDPVITVAPDVPLLRVLQRRREQLRLPDRRPRRLRRRARRGAGHDQRRLLVGALRALSEAAQLSADAVSWSIRPASRCRRQGQAGLPRGEDRPAAELAARASCSSSRR